MSEFTYLTWGAYILPQPDAEGGFNESRKVIGVSRRSASGVLRTDAITTKRIYTLRWTSLSDAEHTIIMNAYLTYAYVSTSMTLPNNITLDVMAPSSGVEISNYYDISGIRYCTMALQVEEV